MCGLKIEMVCWNVSKHRLWAQHGFQRRDLRWPTGEQWAVLTAVGEAELGPASGACLVFWVFALQLRHRGSSPTTRTF